MLNRQLPYRNLALLGHVTFWLGYIVLVSVALSGFMPLERALIRTSIMAGFQFVLAYTHLLVLLPRYFTHKKWLHYGLGILVLLLVTVAGRMLADQMLFEYLESSLRNASVLGPLLFSGQHLMAHLLASMVILCLGFPIKLLDDAQKSQKIQQKLKTRQLEAELRFLKAQVNPHFLFNTLNNIYTLAFIGSEQAAPMIMKLSEMMRYMIYDCMADEVPLIREIQYLQNYIGLQQIKTEHPQQIRLQIEGDPEGILVAPLLFVPLFENAFKHGNPEDISQGWVRSTLRISEGNIHFVAENSISPHQSKHPTGGIGLENIRKRLELRYPDRHTFLLSPGAQSFRVEIQLTP